MSWETLVNGRLKFREGVSLEEQSQILEDLERALETKIEYDGQFDEWCFEDVNWVSHISGEKVWETVKKWRHKLALFDASVYYLGNPEETVLLDRANKSVVVDVRY
mgnify:CR=1 FL=1